MKARSRVTTGDVGERPFELRLAVASFAFGIATLGIGIVGRSRDSLSDDVSLVAIIAGACALLAAAMIAGSTLITRAADERSGRRAFVPARVSSVRLVLESLAIVAVALVAVFAGASTLALFLLGAGAMLIFVMVELWQRTRARDRPTR